MFFLRSKKNENESTITRGKILLQGVSLFFSFIMLAATATMAWFSSNRQVDSSGMQMEVSTTSNLIISKRVDFADRSLLAESDFHVTDMGNRGSMLPATHGDVSDKTNAVHLKYVQNTGDVDPITGVAKTSSTLNWVDVAEANDSRYYIDFVVYIASHGDSFTASSLTAQIVAPTSGTIGDNDAIKATAVDFYVNDTTYKGTLHLADISQTVTLGTSLSINEVETIKAHTQNPVKITMRCYFDGDLAKPDAGRTYITSNQIAQDLVKSVNMTVQFTAVE